MVENVPNLPPPPPYRPISVRIATHHTHGTDQFQRISPNRFGKAIRRNSVPARQGYAFRATTGSNEPSGSVKCLCTVHILISNVNAYTSRNIVCLVQLFITADIEHLF